MIRVIVCDDQEIVCDGLETILGIDPEIEVVGLAHDGARAVDLVQALNPDLVLMDLKMPHMNGIEATHAIRTHYPQVKVLILTTYEDNEWLFDAIRAGASGYLLKDTPRESLIAAVKGTVTGGTHVDPDVAGKLFAHIAERAAPADSTLASTLSQREREVLKLLAQGMSNTEIAERLFLSEGTVRNYVSAIFVKLGVTDRTQAAVIAIKYGLAD